MLHGGIYVYQIAIYRWIFVLLFLSAVATSVVVPVLAIFATDAFDASKMAVSLYFAATAAAGMIVVLVVGRASDFLPSRKTIVTTGFALLALGYILISLSQSFFQMIFVGVVFLSFSAVGSSQLFAVARSSIESEELLANESSITSFLRMAYSLGWVIGPALGGLLVQHVGPREVFRISSVLYVVIVLMVIVGLPGVLDRFEGNDQLASVKRFMFSRNRQLIVFSAAIVCLLSGDIVRISMLPLHLDQTLNASPEALGIAFAITPLAEVPLLPLVGILADRWGAGRIVLGGAVVAFAYYTSLALSTAVWHIYVLQSIYAIVVASVVGVGISYAQKLGRGEIGTATGAYFGSQNAAVMVGSVLAGSVAQLYGIRGSFVLPAILCLVGLALVLWVYGKDREGVAV